MAFNEQILTGRKWRRLIDKAAGLWQRISYWTHSSDVEFNDGKNAETKVGSIDGITDSLASTSSRIAASAKSVNQLSNELAQQPEFVYDATGKITGYKTQAGADTVFPFSGTLITQEFSKNITTNGYQIPQTVTVNGIIYKYVGVKSLTLNSTLISGGGYTISASETGFVSINNPATSAVLKGIALYSIK